MDTSRLSTTDDKSIREYIARAAQGEQLEAWYLIELLACMLPRGEFPQPLADHAAKFFDALLDIREEGGETPKRLAKAFECLHILRPRGQPQRSSDEKDCLAARVLLLVNAGYTKEVAIEALGSKRIGEDDLSCSAGAYKQAFYDPLRECQRGESLGRLAIPTELETIAGIDAKDLVATLRADGSLPPLRGPAKK